MRKYTAERKAEIKASVKETLKGLILPGIIALIIIGLAIFIKTYKAVTEEEPVKIQTKNFTTDPETLYLENDRLKFTFDTGTTLFTVTDKKSGMVWDSVAKDGANDTLAQTNEKEKLQSTFVVTYSDLTGIEQVYNTFKHSVSNTIYEVESGSDYIKIYYSVGEVEPEFKYPPVVTEERYNEITSMLDKVDANELSRYYRKYDAQNPTKLQQKTLEDDLARYPILNDEVCYICSSTIGKAIKVKLEGIFEKIGLTDEEYQESKLRDTSESSSKKPVYNFSVIYKLDGDDLVVEIPLEEIEYPNDKPIYKICILPNFGAADKNDTGFMFVPEGGGALINFNNEKTIQNAYYSDLYGWNYALKRDVKVHETDSSFGVFGASKNGSSYICIIEDGSAYAHINASISGKTTNYNVVNAEYTILARDTYEVTKRTNVLNYQFQDHFGEGECLRQRYRFVASDSYVDMAKSYRDYLIDTYSSEFTRNTDTETPLLLEVIGAIDKVKQVVGIPMGVPLALTECDETTEIVKDLLGNGINNISLKLTGFINGGVKQKWLNSVKPVSQIGGKSGLEKMVKDINALGIKNIYLDGITDFAIDSDLFNGFSFYTDVAYYANKERVKLYEFSTTTFGERDDLDCYWLLNNENEQKMIRNLVEATEKYGIYPSFQDLGNNLSGDYTKKNLYTREMVLEQQKNFIKEKSSMPFIINEGNDYLAPYAEMIDNMNLKGYGYTLIDEEIPFYQIALHGFVNYVGESLNLTGNFNDELLRSAEYGAGLSFTVMDESPFTLQNTLYYSYFGSEYDSCRERILETYNRYNKELGHVFNQLIENHEFIKSDCTCTTYEDGTKVYVNYSYNDDVTVDGITVPSRDYVVVK